MIKRKKTKRIYVGDVPIGDGAPIAVQSMTNTDTKDIEATLEQIKQLKKAGCEIVRLAVPDREAAESFGKIKQSVDIPLIADIHFDHRLAIMAIEKGADGIRINPGNMKKSGLKEVIRAAKQASIPIRIGVNAGSLEKDLLEKYGHPTSEALVESAIRSIRFFEDMGFDKIKISIKSSSVLDTIKAYELLSERTDYPLHLGVTEAGTLISGTVKSSIAIGYLLLKGIGDTLRVSLTRPPVEEVKVAYEILRAVGLRKVGPEIISCPTCGRCQIDLFSLVEEVEKGLSDVKIPIKVAVMGCVVNGPGEAKEADIGIAGGKGNGILFKKGKLLKKVPEHLLAQTLIQEVKRMEQEMRR
ncbi:MAG: 4-hydroxy-3-methylbut-2-en-1-yl diphosphate synthase [Deltaproteobacteria bacterium]|nr:MAG: 4-hydroxy-3-methylbut-2-en-1-yl diphosphate synthase [Deltaproteobacteria bacterium]